MPSKTPFGLDLSPIYIYTHTHNILRYKICLLIIHQFSIRRSCFFSVFLLIEGTFAWRNTTHSLSLTLSLYYSKLFQLLVAFLSNHYRYIIISPFLLSFPFLLHFQISIYWILIAKSTQFLAIRMLKG